MGSKGMLAFWTEDGDMLRFGVATNLLPWPSGSEAALVLVDLRFAFGHLRGLCEMPDQSRSLGMLLALRLSEAASLSLSLSQTYVR
jgi:hypothetical protein